MANQKQRTRKEILANSEQEDKDLLIWALNQCETNLDWVSMAICDWKDHKRVWRPTTLLLKISEGFKDGA